MVGSMVRAVPLLLVAVLGACSGGDGMSPDAMPDAPPVDGTETFRTMIRPLVAICVGCHASGSTEPNLTSYLALGAKYKVKPGATNILVTKANATNGVHYGYPYLDVDGKQTVARWIDSLP